jgi:hypothetical protein
MNEGFEPILEVARIMRGFPAPWFVSGGWAIDLFLGEVTRAHSDIEIGIFRRDQQALRRQLPDWKFEKAVDSGDGGEWVPWEMNEELRLPVHQVKATRRNGGFSEIEFFLNERSDTHWISRRHAGLARAVSEAIFISALKVPALVPEIQLLFKAKYDRPKDRADLDMALRRLNSTQREWLARALSEHHRGHAWIEVIAAQRTEQMLHRRGTSS